MNRAPRRNTPTRLFLVRHAEVEEKYRRVFGGRLDMGLSPRGQEQATVLADYLRRFRIEAIYASPMKRVQQTLAALRTHQTAVPRVVDDLQEIDFGAWTGLRWEEVHERFNLSAFDWLEHLDTGRIPQAETGQQVRRRVEPCLGRILRAHPGQTIAVVCHGGVIRMMLAILLDLPLARMSGLDIEYASLTLVHCRPSRSETQLLNFTPWRDLP
jgi:broad specificity phosphatase PhoE